MRSLSFMITAIACAGSALMCSCSRDTDVAYAVGVISGINIGDSEMAVEEILGKVPGGVSGIGSRVIDINNWQGSKVYRVISSLGEERIFVRFSRKIKDDVWTVEEIMYGHYIKTKDGAFSSAGW